MDALLNSLSKYFPSISVDQNNWVRNPFVEFDRYSLPRSLLWSHRRSLLASQLIEYWSENMQNLDAFWILVENEYPAIAEKAVRFLLQFSTSYMCKFGFSAMITIKQATRTTYCLSKMNFACLSWTFSHELNCCVEITKHTSALKCLLLQTDATSNNKVTRVTCSLG